VASKRETPKRAVFTARSKESEERAEPVGLFKCLSAASCLSRQASKEKRSGKRGGSE
jgi:hypothetical protein